MQRYQPRGTARPAEDEVLAQEDDRAFRRRLAALPVAQWDALALRYGADLTIADVAIVLGKSQHATQKLIGHIDPSGKVLYDNPGPKAVATPRP